MTTFHSEPLKGFSPRQPRVARDPANDNAPIYDVSAGIDGCRLWILRPNGARGALIGQFGTLSQAAREATRLMLVSSTRALP
jgi:hypothetical protein